MEEGDIIKKSLPEDRKQIIIQTALNLFKDNGYENTSISKIIDAASISKGGFYHYFSSKEELLEYIAQSFIKTILNIAHQTVKKENLSGLDKLNDYIFQVNRLKKESYVEVTS